VIPFEEIDKRLEAIGKDRAWLAEVSRRSAGSIRAALAPNALAKSRSKLLQIALSEAIEKEEAYQRKGEVLPDRITIEVDPADFEAFNEAALAESLTVKRWMISKLNEAAAAAKIVPMARQAWQTMDAPSRVADSDEEPGGPARIDEEKTRGGYWIDGHGGIAAGAPIDAVQWEPIPSSKEYPEDHYALKVFGHSMEPRIKDGATIVVREWHDQGFPKKGTIVVYSDANGSTLKELGYRAAKAGEEGNAFGKVAVLKSINPAYSEVQTMEGGRIDAVFVEVL
jgi:SOS-response transcriptional repressor LexA